MSKRKDNENEDIEFKDQKIIPVQMGKEVKTSFINYAMSVIMSRALPDVRDGFKPVHRRILYSMYVNHLTHDKAYCKSATTVGHVLGHYHPHGDSSVYDALVRMAQPFSLRYTMVDGHGNFGNIDGDDAAAYRYTEARMSKMADYMLEDIEKDVVDFVPNFDNKEKEPEVLPSKIPQLLINGSMGIAVGMATNIPTHNIGEVIDGAIYLMDHPDCTTRDLMNIIKGPDFPTGAIICGQKGIYDTYETGKGKIRVRARAVVDEDKKRIVVTEIPYQVNKVALVEAMVECHKDKKVEGITDIRDETGKDGLKIVIEYRKDVNGQVLLNQLYKFTPLEYAFAANMLALVDNVPKILSLKQILFYYVEHQENVLKRKLNFDLKKAIAELHVNEGYKVASENIDEVVEIIKASENVQIAKANLSERFGLDDIQTQAIVDMTLGKLTGLERKKIEDKISKLNELVEDIEDKLSSEDKIKEIIKEEILAIKEKTNDERKTEISFDEEDIEDEDLIDKHTCVITLTHAGYMKRMQSDSYSAQARGGKGIKGITTKEEDFVETVIAVNSHSDLLLFTTNGKVFTKRAYQIPEASRTAKGTNAVNLFELSEGEKVTAMVSVEEYAEDKYLLMVTKNGVVKRTNLKEFEYQRKGGKIAISLDEGDELVYVRLTTGSDEVIIATKGGNATRFDENDARVMGRTARGVRGIRLEENDYVIGVALVDNECTLLTITENGYGKRSSFDDFKVKNRGGKGVTAHSLSEKTGMLASIVTVHEDDDIVIISNDGVTIRTHVDQISKYSRTASGVIVMRMGEGALVTSVANVGKQEENEAVEESEDTLDIEIPSENLDTNE